MSNNKDYYFIDYDDVQENGDDTYNVLFGDEKTIEQAQLVARFVEDEDAMEYCDFMNHALDQAEDTFLDEIPDEEIPDLTDEEYWVEEL